MANKWKIWLASSDEYTACDSESEIALTSLPTALQTVAEPNWTPVWILALDKQNVPWDDESLAQAVEYNLQLEPFVFPEDMPQRDTIDAIFRNKWIYLCLDGDGQTENKYPNTSNFIHGAGKCLALTDTKERSMEHPHDDGVKDNSYRLRNRLPKL